jgi:hypothetical protein
MMKKYHTIKIIMILGLLAYACTQDEFREPLSNSSHVPLNVSGVTFESMPGAVRVSYQIPEDAEISNVIARYTLSNGTTREVRGSNYVNSLLLEGFADTLTHEVELFTVSRSEVLSDVEILEVTALESPIWKVNRSVEISNQFGGYNITATNDASTYVTFFVMEKNDIGEFEVDITKSFSTSVKDIIRKVRGLDTLEQSFKYFIADRWGNSTDTTLAEFKPYFEVGIPKTGYKEVRLPGDAEQVRNGNVGLSGAWDDLYEWPYTSFTLEGYPPGPHMVTIDLGDTVRLSRWWYRPWREYIPHKVYYYLATLRDFEIYGTLQYNPSGALDSTWTLMGQFEVIKPSGLPKGTDSEEDIATAEAGINFEFDADLPKVRYIRIRSVRNWADAYAQNIQECEFFGDPRKDN